MDRKERVWHAVHHQAPDRVPIDYSANPGIDARLKAHFGLEPNDGGGLAKALGVPKARVRILSGATSRLKQIAVDGDPAMLGEALRKLTAAKKD